MQKKWGVAAAFLIAILLQILFINWTCDDSFISFRYADNLARGDGLVFNPGESVEGYSNFLWVLILAGGRLIGLAPLLLSKGLGVLAALLSLFLLYRTIGLWRLDPVLQQGVVLLLGLTAGFAYFAVSGMETVFYAALLLLAVFLQKKYDRDSKPARLYFLYGTLFLISLTRPEGILFFGLTGLFHWTLYFRRRFLHPWRTLLFPQILWGASYGLFLLWRLTTYGDLLPNTFYAKPPGTFVSYESTALFGNLIKALPSGSFLLLLIPVLLIWKKRRIDFVYPLLIILGQLVFISYSGDWMAFGRFFLPVLPLGLLVSAAAAASLKEGKKRIRPLYPAVVLSAVLLYAGLNGLAVVRSLNNEGIYPYSVMKSTALQSLGRRLKEGYSPETVICIRRQGAVPYVSGFRSIDLLGLTDRTIARFNSGSDTTIEANSKTAQNIIRRRPDVILLFAAEGLDQGWMFDYKYPYHRLYHREYLLYQKALESGYSLVSGETFGENEILLILENNHLPEKSGME